MISGLHAPLPASDGPLIHLLCYTYPTSCCSGINSHWYWSVGRHSFYSHDTFSAESALGSGVDLPDLSGYLVKGI